jgi:hypothetical protein
MKILILASILILFPFNLLAQSWTAPQALAGLGTTGGMFVDPNGTLFFNQTGKLNLAVAPERPFRQFLNSSDTLSEPVAYPLFPTNSGISQKGAPSSVIQDLNGNRIVVWTIGGTVGGFPVMRYQKLDGTFGPNSISLGGNAAISLRNGLVIGLFQSPNGEVLVKEWTITADGSLVESPFIAPLISAEEADFGGCGAAIGIDADNSAVAIFQGNLQVRSANRSSAGVWTLNPAVIDSVTANVESMGCVSAKASPGGRIVAAWWNTQVGVGTNVDRGGSVRALVREAGKAVPASYITIISNAPSTNHSRRTNGVSVAIGLDGTAGVLASTAYCVDKSLRSSQGILRLAGPADDFISSADTAGIGAMNSGANKIWADSISPANGFAVENKKAVFGVHANAYPNVGTDLRPSCGAGQQITEPQTFSTTAVYYDGVSDTLSSQEIQSAIIQPGTFSLFQGLVDAALDFNGNAAIVRAPLFGQTSDVIFRGDWQSGTFDKPEATPTPTNGVNPQVPFLDNVKNQIAKALTLLAIAKKPLPTGNTAKDKTNKSKITVARKDLNGIIAILIGLVKTNAAEIQAANYKNFSDKNLKDIKNGIKAGLSKNSSAKNKAAGWKKAKGLLAKLAS